VSGSAGSRNAADRDEAIRRMKAFCDAAGWAPELTASFAGAVTYTQYNPLLRWMMRRISRREGGSTDTSRDHEYTDWAQVATFATAFAELMARSREPNPEPAAAESHPAAASVGEPAYGDGRRFSTSTSSK
jgi:menaquinone-dependent protoporphyrinogen oxidase